jgi:hypoxanthine phosphoribosyltransferase
MTNWNDDVKKVLVSEEEAREICERLGKQIDEDYKDSESLVLVGILKGSVVFMADLIRKISRPVQIDFMRVSSYGDSTTSSGNVNIILDLNRKNLPNEDILIVEDIVDSGKTLKYLIGYLLHKGAKSVRTVTLLDKPERREIDYSPDYIGKRIENGFVIGYGLDCAEYYRNLPYIAEYSEE